MTRELHALAQWLHAAQVTAVAMEATGVYWMPVWNVLEQEKDASPPKRALKMDVLAHVLQKS